MNNVASKLFRLMNPQTAEDFGLSLSLSELKTVPEFGDVIAEAEVSSAKNALAFKECMRNAENTRAGLVLKVLMGNEADHD